MYNTNTIAIATQSQICRCSVVPHCTTAGHVQNKYNSRAGPTGGCLLTHVGYESCEGLFRMVCSFNSLRDGFQSTVWLSTICHHARKSAAERDVGEKTFCRSSALHSISGWPVWGCLHLLSVKILMLTHQNHSRMTVNEITWLILIACGLEELFESPGMKLTAVVKHGAGCECRL